MIGRFRHGTEILCGQVEEDHVRVDRGMYYDTFHLENLKILPPVSPSKIVCAGLNYVDHARELGMDIPERPVIFLKPPSAVIGQDDKIVYPPQSRQVDFEAELAVVIGKRCKNVSRENAVEVIFGYTCFNDVTARDLQKEDRQWTRSKSFDTFAPIGPYIVEAKDVDAGNLRIMSRVNGEVRQDSSTSNFIFDIPYLVEFISHIMTLERGDVIATGTPHGVGELFVHDVVEIDIEGIGILRNEVV
ncbi:MAG TPA: fumarylacetoacetate hydrolase family protein [Candidatus Methanoperedenaceae archaeon]|nr:fumarylacetoacetate hydrolase family protein [Candidatus Methanoperedenaceae archaeon]